MSARDWVKLEPGESVRFLAWPAASADAAGAMRHHYGDPARGVMGCGGSTCMICRLLCVVRNGVYGTRRRRPLTSLWLLVADWERDAYWRSTVARHREEEIRFAANYGGSAQRVIAEEFGRASRRGFFR